MSDDRMGAAAVGMPAASDIDRLLFEVHPDIRDLLWFLDGPYQNIEKVVHSSTNAVDGPYAAIPFTVTVTHEIRSEQEPSAISLSLPVSARYEPGSPPTGYSPTYRRLDPDQRRVYWEFLRNPYDASFDVGYAFLLYYGLERHMHVGQFAQAFDVVSRLGKAYPKICGYADDARIYTAMKHSDQPRLSIAIQEAFDHYAASAFALFAAAGTGLPFPLWQVERLANAVGVRSAYQKTAPDIFSKCLSDVLIERFDAPHILLTDIADSFGEPVVLVANGANLSVRSVGAVPDVAAAIKAPLKELFDEAHQNTKAIRAQERRQNRKRKNSTS